MLLIQRSLRFLLLLVIALTLGPLARAQSGSAVTAVEEAAIEASIKDLPTQWSTAYLKNDTSILERIWAPKFYLCRAIGAPLHEG